MASAIAFTCAELIGSGSVATAAFMASFMMPIVSGGKLAFEKSFIRPVLIPVVTRPTTSSSSQTHISNLSNCCGTEVVPSGYVETIGKSVVNHWFGQGFVFRRNRYDWVPICRIASCESTRLIAGQYLLKLQRDCASFWQKNNRKSRVLSRAKSTAYANWMKTRPRLFRHSARRASGLVPDRWLVEFEMVAFMSRRLCRILHLSEFSA